MVTTLDGKITTRDGAGSKFASQADAIIIGAELLLTILPSTFQPNIKKIGQIKNPGKSYSGRIIVIDIGIKTEG